MPAPRAPTAAEAAEAAVLFPKITSLAARAEQELSGMRRTARVEAEAAAAARAPLALRAFSAAPGGSMEAVAAPAATTHPTA